MPIAAAGIVVAILGLRILGAWALPPTLDEAYYFEWSRNLSLGYFDHPPFVAWIAWTHQLADNIPLISRLGTLATGTLYTLVCCSFLKKLNLTSQALWTVGLLLTQFNLVAIACGFLTTPDAIFLLLWTLTLHEVWAAITPGAAPWRWWTAGLCAGLAMLAKYVAILMLPVILWMLWRHPNLRRQSGIYQAIVVAALAFSPNLVWNAQNDWVSFRTQLRHGFVGSIGSGDRSDASTLPHPEVASEGTIEFTMGEHFARLDPPPPEKPSRERSQLEKLGQRIGDFVGSQLGLWGFLIFPILWSFVRRRKGTSPSRASWSSEQGTLLMAGTAVPLLFFGVITLASKVEGNWPAVYTVAAALWLTPRMQHLRKSMLIGALANGIVVVLLLAHAKAPFLPVKTPMDRILKETSGFASLADLITPLTENLYVETYQLKSMLAYYAPDRMTDQYPNLTRDSEFTRRPPTQAPPETDFWLLSTRRYPPLLEGFRPIDGHEIRNCSNGLQTIRALVDEQKPCPSPRHLWYLVRYRSTASKPIGSPSEEQP